MPKPTRPVHRTSDWCHTEAPKEITKILLRCGYECGYYSQIFDDFLDACEIWLDRLPTAFSQIAHRECLQDPPDIADRWQRLEKKYKEQTLRYFADAFGVMLDATTDEEGNLTYADLFGGTFMGNMTVIGSTANIVALGVLEKRGHGTVAFWQWMKIGLIVSLASMVVSYLLALVIFGYGLTISQPFLFAISLVLTVVAFVSFSLIIAPIFVMNPSVQQWQNGQNSNYGYGYR